MLFHSGEGVGAGGGGLSSEPAFPAADGATPGAGCGAERDGATDAAALPVSGKKPWSALLPLLPLAAPAREEEEEEWPSETDESDEDEIDAPPPTALWAL